MADSSITRSWSLEAKLAYYSAPGPGNCRLWTGAQQKGYGSLKWEGRHAGAHRLAWQIEKGPIPDGLLVCHNCPSGDNPLCINVDHLWLGTDATNAADRDRKGRLVVPPGRFVWPKKLTQEKARAVFNAIGKHTDIAQSFGVTRVTVSMIKRKKTWRHIHA